MAAPAEARVTALAGEDACAEWVLIPDATRPRKAVRGARSAGGERTWLRLPTGDASPVAPLPLHASLRVACRGRTFLFALQPGTTPAGAVVLRRPAADCLECELGSLLHDGFVLQLRLRAASPDGYVLGDAAITLPHARPACASAPAAVQRTTACLEAALQMQRGRCEEIAAAHAALSSRAKALDGASAELDRLRCELGELSRLLRQAKQAEAELKQDVLARRQWDRYHSGEETRDVLENGVRRAHMEARLGREVTREDVEVSLQIPFAERARLIGVDPLHEDAPRLRHLPFARGPDL